MIVYTVPIKEKDGKTSDCKGHAIRNGQLKKGASPSVAAAHRLTPRHVRWLWAEFCVTGSLHVSNAGAADNLAVWTRCRWYQTSTSGKCRLLHVAMNLREGHNTRYSKVYRIKGERTCDPVSCQIQKMKVDTLRAKVLQFPVACVLARHKVYTLWRPEPYNLS